MAMMQLITLVAFSVVTMLSVQPADSILDGPNSAFLGADPRGRSSKGNEFYVGFIANNRNNADNLPTAGLFVTTDEEEPVSFTVTYELENMQTGTQTGEATRETTLLVRLPVGQAPFTTDIRVGSNTERNKGIYLKADGNKLVTVYGINDAAFSTDAFLALPAYSYDVDEYRYFIFSATVVGTTVSFQSRFLLVGTEDDTEVTIIPTRNLDVPADISESGGVETIDWDGLPAVNTGTVTINRLETVLFASADDLTGSIITSNKPLSVFVGHECGQIPADQTACDHLVEQIPPDTTWGTQFFTVPLDLRESGEVYRVGTVTDDNRVVVTCTTEGQTPRTVRNETVSTTRGVDMKQWVEFETVGDTTNGVTESYRRDFCCIETSKPAVVMMYAKGHSVDEILIEGVNDAQGDPFMLLIPPLSQYSNNYTVTSAKSVRTVFNGHISWSFPIQFFNNTARDRNAFRINGSTFTPQNSNGYQPIYCANGEICGYGAYDFLPVGNHRVEYDIPGAAMNLFLYGFFEEISFGYPAGFELDAVGVPRISIFNITVFENAGTVVVPINRTGGDLSRNTVIRASTRDVSAVSTAGVGQDYVARSNVRVRWQADQVNPRTGPNDPAFEFEIIDDETPEDRGEYFEIVLTLTRNGVFFPYAVGRVTILDNDIPPQIGFDPTSYRVNENAGVAMLTITTTDPTSFTDATGALFYTTDGTASGSGGEADFTGISRANAIPIIFESGQISTIITIPIATDDRVEGDEQFMGQIISGGGIDNIEIFAPTADVTIVDDDVPVFGFEFDEYTFSESVGMGIVAVTLDAESGQLSENVVFTFSTLDGSAEAPGDYTTVTSMEYTFIPGVNRVEIPVTIVNDGEFEGPENFVATIETNHPGAIITLDMTAIEITDDDRINVGFDPVSYSVNEADGFAELTIVKFSNPPALMENITVIFSTTDGSALAGQDYMAVSDEVILLLEETSVTVQVPIINDDDFEQDPNPESFFGNLVISSMSADIAQVSVPQATVNISDDDESVVVEFSPITYTVTEGETAMLTVVLSMPFNQEVRVALQTGDVSATDPDDYTGVTRIVTFPIGVTEQIVPVSTEDDDKSESLETFIATLSSANPDVVTIGQSQATVSIRDNDAVQVSFENPSYTANEEDGTVEVCFTTSTGHPDRDIVVEVQVQEGTSASCGDAPQASGGGDDYFALMTTHTFTMSATSGRLCRSIMIISDEIYEGSEQFLVTFSNLPDEANRVEVGDISQACVLITDENDIPRFNITTPDVIVREDEGPAVVCVTVSNNVDSRFTSGATATVVTGLKSGADQATAGVDYTSTTMVLTFMVMDEPGLSRACANIPITDDVLGNEPNERFSVTFSGFTPDAGIAGEVAEACVTIVDNDVPVLTWEDDEVTIPEGDDMELCFNANIGSAVSYPVVVTASGKGSNPADGNDYSIGPSDTVTFQVPASESGDRFCVDINILTDNIDEAQEQLRLAFSNTMTGLYNPGDPSEVCINIEDTTRPVIRWEVPEVTVTEGGSTEACFVSDIGSVAPYDVIVGVRETVANPATRDEDYSLQGSLTFTVPASTPGSRHCVPINTVDDTSAEGTEQFELIFTNLPDGSVDVGTPSSVLVSIRDNDVPEVNIVMPNITVPEDMPEVEICIMLTTGVQEQVIVTAETGPKGGVNDATGGSDYAITTFMLTFDPSDDGQTLCGNVPIIDDDIGLEPDELFSVRITSVTGSSAMIGDDETCVEIIDNDVPEIEWEEREVNITEGGDRQVCFTSDIGTAAAYNVMVAALPKGSRPANLGADYSVDSSLSFNIPVMSSGGRYCVDLSTVDDNIAEGTEQFQLVFSSVTPATRGDPDILCVNIIDNDDPIVDVEVGNITVPEDMPEVDICITLSTGVTEQVVVTAETGPKGGVNDATGGFDYEITTFMLTFDPSDDGQTLCGNVSIIDDDLGLEPDELFSVRIRSVVGSTAMIGDDETCVEIIDNDVPEISWEVPRVIIPEGGSREVCFTSDIGTASAYNVMVAASPKGTRPADLGDDYSVDSSLSFNIPVMLSGGRYCVDLSTVEDNIAEGMEQFELSFSSITPPGSATRGDPDVVCVDITDTDVPEVIVERPNITVPEGTPDVEICIRLTTGVTEQVIVTAETGPKSGAANPATADSDYSTRTLMLTFDPSDDGQTVCGRVPIIDDDLGLEPNELFSVRITSVSGSNAVIGLDDETCVEITDNDVPEVKWDDDEVTIPEGENRTLCFTSDIGTAVSYDVRVALRGKGDNQAMADEDYVVTSNLDFTIPAMGSGGRYCVDLSIVDDTKDEGNEQFVLFFPDLPSTSTTVGVPEELCVTIADNDRLTVSYERAEYTVGESDGTVEVCVQTNIGHTSPVEVMIRPVEKPSATYPATNLDDFVGDIITVTFDTSSVSETICVNIPIISDSIYEDDEQFLVEFANIPNDQAGEGPIPTACITIVDDDEPTFIIDPPEVNVTEPEGRVMICVETSSALGRNVVVTAVTGMKDGAVNIATAGDDYRTTTFMFTFMPTDQSSQRLCGDVIIENDMIGNEPNEEFSVRLISASPGGIIDGQESCVTIIDDDVVGIEFDTMDFTVNEDNGTVFVCLTKNITTQGDITIVFDAEEEAGVPNPADDEEDFQPGLRMIIFPAGSRMTCGEVPIKNDDNPENNEVFMVTFRAENLVIPPRPDLPAPVAEVTIIDDDRTGDMFTCRFTEPQRVQTYSFPPTSTYGFIDVCEHIATSLCNPVDGFDVRVAVDFLTETMDNGAVGLLINDLRYVSREDGTFDAGNQIPTTSSPEQREYSATGPTRVVVDFSEGVTNITFLPGDALDAEITIIHTYAGDDPSIEINVRSSNNATEFCGLCGSRAGQLRRPDGTIADRNNMAEREAFTRLYTVDARDQILRPQRRVCGTIRNDTVIGDPLYAAPVYSEDGREYSLCYEVFGRTNSTLNLVSDTCVNVNARYGPMNNPLDGNIINAVGVRAKGLSDNSCYNIRVNLDGCSAQIDSANGLVELDNLQSFEQDGISVRKYPRRVRIAAPNCENVMLVMWVICENRNDNDMIKFVIARGVNLRPSSHGLLGQFWNVEATFTKFNGTGLHEDADPSRYYVVTVDSASGGPSRSFLGEFYHLKWDKSREPCLYAGNAQGGPSYEVEEPNDSIIEGRYRDYIVSDEDENLFETQYTYSQFEEGRC